jgi:hypothetical protein
MTLFNRFSRFALAIVMIAENAGIQGFIDPEALKLIFLLISVIIQILGPPHRQKRASVACKISFCCVTRKQAEHCSKTTPRVKTKLSAPNEPTFQTYLPKKPLSYNLRFMVQCSDDRLIPPHPVRSMSPQRGTARLRARPYGPKA